MSVSLSEMQRELRKPKPSAPALTEQRRVRVIPLFVRKTARYRSYGSLTGHAPDRPMASANPTTDLTTVAPSMYSFDSSDDPIDFLMFGARGATAARHPRPIRPRRMAP